MKLSNSSTSSFKTRFIGLLARYVIIAVVLVYGVDLLFSSVIIPSNETTNYAKLNRLIHENHPEEIPLLGSSTVLRGLMADQLGEHFYNYGITATNFQKLAPLLEIELAKDKTSPIIIDMPPQFFMARPKPNIRMEDMLPFSRNTYIREFMKEYDFYEPWHDISGLRYFGNYTTYFGSYMSTQLPSDMSFSRGGKHVGRKTPADKFAQFIELRSQKPLPYKASPELLNTFKKLLSSTDRPIVLVVFPFYKTVYETGFDLASYTALIEELSTEYPHVSGFVADGREYLDSDFLDTIHLNYQGALKFSKQLRQALTETGVIAASRE